MYPIKKRAKSSKQNPNTSSIDSETKDKYMFQPNPHLQNCHDEENQNVMYNFRCENCGRSTPVDFKQFAKTKLHWCKECLILIS